MQAPSLIKPHLTARPTLTLNLFHSTPPVVCTTLQRLFALQAAERLMMFLHACEVREMMRLRICRAISVYMYSGEGRSAGAVCRAEGPTAGPYPAVQDTYSVNHKAHPAMPHIPPSPLSVGHWTSGRGAGPLCFVPVASQRPTASAALGLGDGGQLQFLVRTTGRL